MRRVLITTVASAALILGGNHIAAAAPSSGSSSGSSGSAGGSPGPARSAADRQFLRESYFDDESYATQDAAIRLAHADCNYLDAYGNSASNRIYLAESSRKSVEYPYLFLGAAIDAYCPWNAH
jgi:hypothetical protein